MYLNGIPWVAGTVGTFFADIKKEIYVRSTREDVRHDGKRCGKEDKNCPTVMQWNVLLQKAD
jgi:hypothetical protein